MEQLYLIELFVRSLTIYLDAEDPAPDTNKELFIRCMFGPKSQFLFKESTMYPANYSSDIIDKVLTEKDLEDRENPNRDVYAGKVRRRWVRFFRVGKAFLFPAFPDNLLLLLERYPLEFSVWSSRKDEDPELIGTANMHWHTEFYSHIRESVGVCTPSKALSIKEIVPIMSDCCCFQAGELQLIIRLAPLGSSITTEFQQRLDKNPDIFAFRTDRCPSLFECQQIEMDDKEYITTGSIYETECREDPELQKKINRKVEICSELESCGIPQPGTTFACQHRPNIPQATDVTLKEYPVEKIRMGDILGPCGNANCLIAHKMRAFIRMQYAYKKETSGRTFPAKTGTGKSKRVCGQCGCKHDLYHAEKPDDDLLKKPICSGCGGVAQSGETCNDRLQNLYGTGVTPLSSTTHLPKNQSKDEKK